MKVIKASSWKNIQSILRFAVIFLLVIDIPAGLLGVVYGQFFHFLQLGTFLAAVIILPICIVYLVSMLLSRIEIRNNEVIYKTSFFQMYGSQRAEIRKIASIALEAKFEWVGQSLSLIAVNFYSQSGEKILYINPFVFENKSLRDLLLTLQNFKPDITFNKYALELIEKGSLPSFESKYILKPFLIMIIPVVILFLIPIFIALGTHFTNGGLSQYQKTLLPDLFLSIMPLSISIVCGVVVYFMFLKQHKILKEWIIIGSLGTIFLFFIGITSLLQWQVYNDWGSQPKILIGQVKDLRIGVSDEPSLLFKVGGSDHLWDIPVEEANNDKDAATQTDLYRKLSQGDNVIKIYYSPNYNALIKIEDAKSGEVIYIP